MAFHFRSIARDDYEQVKKLHEEFFPVRYSDKFFKEICTGKLRGGDLFSSMAIDSRTTSVIGFVLAQIVSASTLEDKDLFAQKTTDDKVCYILTIGLKETYRKSGLGSNLVRQCIHYSERFTACGAVYLHVIHYNTAAIRLYRSMQFEWLKTLQVIGVFNRV